MGLHIKREIKHSTHKASHSISHAAQKVKHGVSHACNKIKKAANKVICIPLLMSAAALKYISLLNRNNCSIFSDISGNQPVKGYSNVPSLFMNNSTIVSQANNPTTAINLENYLNGQQYI